MKDSIRKELQRRKARIQRRLDKTKMQDPALLGRANVHYEMASRLKGISAGGIGAINLLVKQLGLPDEINRCVNVFKLYAPYAESDHVLNIAFNILAGGERLEHLELLRNNEAYLDAVGVRRIPDPTTAGDFCRRFSSMHIEMLMDVFNRVRLKVWRQQPSEFFDEAVIDADGTMAPTLGERKFGMNINFKGEWGYHPLIVSLANTGEPLFIVNRPGNRPSHEQAPEYFNKAIALCRNAGFRKVTLRGDTDFSLTGNFDAWDDDGVEFIFGFDAIPTLYEMAENLPENAWKVLERQPKYEVRTAPRTRRPNVKEKIVEEREFDNIKLNTEYVAEFDYQPGKCGKVYRVVVLWKDLTVRKGQAKLWDDVRCFFYITNDRTSTAEEIVLKANGRCKQESTVIEQLKGGVCAMDVSLDNLLSNWAYMVMASLAWSLKAWTALLLPVSPRWPDKHQREKAELLWMEFSTFRQAWINIPAQIVRTGGRIVYRLLSWNPWLSPFFRLLDVLQQPMRC